MINIRSFRAMLLIFLSTLCLSMVSSAATASDIGRQDGGPLTVSRDDAYLLGPGDKIRISVYGEDGMTSEYLVSEAGAISFPLIGDFPVGNRTVSQMCADLEKRLAEGIVNKPRISAQILEFRPFYILGEINRPGQYPYSLGLTLYSAVATAQGFTYRASTHKVMITHAGDGIERVIRVRPDTRIHPGDTIRIVEKFF